MVAAPRIIIDAGHGGSERAGNSTAYGARGASGITEKDVSLDIAKHVIARLGGSATLTRSGDKNMTIGARAAKGRQADVFVSIHANYGAPDLSGPEVYVHPEAGHPSRALAGQISRALDHQAGRYGGGDDERRAAMAVLNPSAIGARTAACLVEVDYLSNPRCERRLADPRERAAIGAAIAGAIQEHLTSARSAYGQQDPWSPSSSALGSGSLTVQAGIPGSIDLLLTNANNGGNVCLEGTITLIAGNRPQAISARFIDLASQGIMTTARQVREPSVTDVPIPLASLDTEPLRWSVPFNPGPARIEFAVEATDPQTRVRIEWRVVTQASQILPPPSIPMQPPQATPLGGRYGGQLTIRGREYGRVLINVPHQQPPDTRTLTFRGTADLRAGGGLRLGASIEDPSARDPMPRVTYVDLDPYAPANFSFSWPCRNLLTPGVYEVVLRVDGANQDTEIRIEHGYDLA